MLEQEDRKELFDDKYAKRLGMSYDEWVLLGIDTEDQAYERLQQVDDELKESYDNWFEAEGREKTDLEDYRDRLKAEYDLLEEMFGLELHDK